MSIFCSRDANYDYTLCICCHLCDCFVNKRSHMWKIEVFWSKVALNFLQSVKCSKCKFFFLIFLVFPQDFKTAAKYVFWFISKLFAIFFFASVNVIFERHHHNAKTLHFFKSEQKLPWSGIGCEGGVIISMHRHTHTRARTHTHIQIPRKKKESGEFSTRTFRSKLHVTNFFLHMKGICPS